MSTSSKSKRTSVFFVNSRIEISFREWIVLISEDAETEASKQHRSKKQKQQAFRIIHPTH